MRDRSHEVVVAPRVPPSALHTYRALRVGLVVAGGLLLTVCAIEQLRSGTVPSSVSALFYTPAGTVFTGVLLAVAVAMIAVKGRSGWENGLLDGAGVVLPLVAFVPTPVVITTLPTDSALDAACPLPDVACVPTQLAPAVTVSVLGYAVVGLVTLVARWVAVLRRRSDPAWAAHARWTTAGISAVWALVLGWFLLGRDSFDRWAHYASAVTFFALLVAVVVINPRAPSPTDRPTRIAARSFRRAYSTIALVMAGTTVAGVVTFLVLGEESSFPLTFWLEIALLVSFIAFWVAQTLELWDVAEPPPVDRATTSSGASSPSRNRIET